MGKIIWSEKEKEAWAPLKKLLPSEWAEQFRVLLPPSAEPGKYHLSRTPYAKGIHDATTEPGVEEIVCLKCSRVGWTTVTQNLLGYWADREPGPILLVMPSEHSAEEMMENIIIPLCEGTPVLKKHLNALSPRDTKKHSIKFDTCTLQIGWAGSPQSLATKDCRRVILDEVDKYPAFSGREADPINLARERTKTYGHRKTILLGSTPTIREGAIWRAWEDCGDKRHYYVPCPLCGFYQRLLYPQIRKPELGIEDRTKEADKIQLEQLAWYECEDCKGEIKNEKKNWMLTRGQWLSETQSIGIDGVITGDRPKTVRVGFRLNTLYSPWTSFSDIIAEGLRSIGSPGRIQNFRNSWLAEPYEEQITKITVSGIRDKLDNAPEALIVPRWAGVIVASADVHKNLIYYVVRAWGAGYRSQLVNYGITLTFEDLKKITLDTPYRLESSDTRAASLFGNLLVIDAGYRTDDVIKTAQTDARVLCVKGASKKHFTPIYWSKAFSQYGIRLALVDTEQFKDKLNQFITTPDQWLVNSGASDEYFRQLTAEHKVRVVRKNRIEEHWIPISEGAQNHYFDCENYNVVGAEVLGVGLIPDISVLENQRQQQQQQQTEEQPDTHKKQWINTGKGKWL